MEAGRQAECPNCGAPIAWQLASSHSLVCSFCRFAVVRSDRGLGANGRVADLVPTAAPIAVGDEGAVGGKTFQVLGRTQLDHGRGPWDEWYLGFADGTWGWLARAEGRWYLTFARELESAPSWDALTPGSETLLSGTASMRWVVTERGGSALVSAEGELPFAVEPQASGRYVDLEGDDGAFATLDYGVGGAVQLFAGRELPARELTLKQTALGPRPVEKVEVERLSCPKCGAPIPIFVPSETERCGCEACGALLDYTEGALRLLTQLDPPAVRPLIALGTQGELLGRMRTVTGFMQRMLKVDGDLYTFREYLLHSEQGYSWLVEENHHWLHVAPVATSAVRERASGALYDGRVYRAFAKGHPVVDFVIGEFYWKVEAGDACETFDYVAPPRVLSVERTPSELSWSEGEYVTRAQLQRAFALKQELPAPIGVGAAEPNPHTKRGAALVFALLALLWFVLAFAYELGTRKEVLLDTTLLLSPHEAGTPTHSNTVFSEPFEVRRGPTTL
ncbi:MAG: hypothetical protein JWN04_4760, partial [Myxococcaceae bacterium]|nr:hypothetical protein [Myxococcaceae bacterium]